MKFLSLLTLLSLLSACHGYEDFQTSSHLQDTGGGNTGDGNARQRRLMVFPGKEDLSYCVRIDPDAPLAYSENVLIIENAFKAWQRLINHYDIQNKWRAKGGQSLPSTLTLKDNCHDVDLEFVYGSSPSSLQKHLQAPRDSAISALFNIEERVVFWIAGTDPVLPPSTQTFSPQLPMHLEAGHKLQVDLTLRYLFGRFYGNKFVRGTVMEKLPEQWLSCAEHSARCRTMMDNSIIELEYKILTHESEDHGATEGCFLGFGPVMLQYQQSAYSIPAIGVKEKWLGKPRQNIIEDEEVFAQGDQPHFFSKRVIYSGFTGQHSYGTFTINVKNGAQIEWRCDENIIVFQTSDTCGSEWSPLLAQEAWQNLLNSCTSE